jgi:hypothetical protein
MGFISSILSSRSWPCGSSVRHTSRRLVAWQSVSDAQQTTRDKHRTCRQGFVRSDTALLAHKTRLVLGEVGVGPLGQLRHAGPQLFVGRAQHLRERGEYSEHTRQSSLITQQTLKMQSSSSTLERPGKRGLPVTISAWMQPEDHTSMEVLYCCEPSSTSGGRYHSVTTSLEYARVVLPNARASPKSASFSSCSARVGETSNKNKKDRERTRNNGPAKQHYLLLVDEQVLRLEVAVQVAMRVAVRDAAQRLVRKALDVLGADLAVLSDARESATHETRHKNRARLGHVLLEVVLQELKHQLQLGGRRLHVHQRHNVGMLELCKSVSQTASRSPARLP